MPTVVRTCVGYQLIVSFPLKDSYHVRVQVVVARAKSFHSLPRREGPGSAFSACVCELSIASSLFTVFAHLDTREPHRGLRSPPFEMSAMAENYCVIVIMCLKVFVEFTQVFPLP